MHIEFYTINYYTGGFWSRCMIVYKSKKQAIKSAHKCYLNGFMLTKWVLTTAKEKAVKPPKDGWL